MRISDWSSDVCSSDLGEHRDVIVDAVILRVVGELYQRPLLLGQIGQVGLEGAPVAAVLDPGMAGAVGPQAEPQAFGRSEERRVGKACVRTFSSSWSPYHYNQHNTIIYYNIITI